MEADLNRGIQTLKGIGPKRADALKKIGIFTLRDLLYYFPRAYEDLSNVKSIISTVDGEVSAVKAKLSSEVKTKRTGAGGKYSVSRFVVFDGSADMTVVLFNRRFQADALKKDTEYIFYGKTEVTGIFREMKSPRIEPVEETAIQPVYTVSAGIPQKMIRNAVRDVLAVYAERVPETLPKVMLEKFGLPGFAESLVKLHRPKTQAEIADARRRFILEELFIFRLGISASRAEKAGRKAPSILCGDDVPERLYSFLPYTPTGAQRRVVKECLSDMRKASAMARLVQGDVGSGKTLVAAALIYCAAGCGFQSCLMAPTEILAIQHYDNLKPLFDKAGVSCRLLTGSTPAAERKEILSELETGACDLLIGTHAVIQKGVSFKKLGLTVTDEQHRFGVSQRAALAEKGDNPHVLVMSATPIPRSMALILYGDLDVSVIDELPAGRQKISTFLVGTDYRDRMYNYLREQVNKGCQAYVVCPAIEENEDYAQPMTAVKTFWEALTDKWLRYLSVGYLHGKMKPKEKETALRDFYQGRTRVLVSTTVIEVGINVPNSTIMIIENAERFGLSQLHQLRGRVGRGSKKSYCFLVSDSEQAKERLTSFCSASDGFEISRLDLEQRGPGDFFGSRQHGLPDFSMASLTDMNGLDEAGKMAEYYLSVSKTLSAEETRNVEGCVKRLFSTAAVN